MYTCICAFICEFILLRGIPTPAGTRALLWYSYVCILKRMYICICVFICVFMYIHCLKGHADSCWHSRAIVVFIHRSHFIYQYVFLYVCVCIYIVLRSMPTPAGTRALLWNSCKCMPKHFYISICVLICVCMYMHSLKGHADACWHSHADMVFAYMYLDTHVYVHMCVYSCIHLYNFF